MQSLQLARVAINWLINVRIYNLSRSWLLHAQPTHQPGYTISRSAPPSSSNIRCTCIRHQRQDIQPREGEGKIFLNDRYFFLFCGAATHKRLAGYTISPWNHLLFDQSLCCWSPSWRVHIIVECLLRFFDSSPIKLYQTCVSRYAVGQNIITSIVELFLIFYCGNFLIDRYFFFAYVRHQRQDMLVTVGADINRLFKCHACRICNLSSSHA